jgi:NAD(P)-dependent dehydrogenase (short-subunit alcohol dehydrogenase family)
MARTPNYFHGKTAVITGGGSGIGRAAALIFAREGARVVAADIDTAAGLETQHLIQSAGGEAEFINCDVTRRKDVQKLMTDAIARFGRIDALFNSAGSALRRCGFLEIDDELFERSFDLNVKGTFWAMQAILPHMLQRGGGVIINMGSMAHKRGGPGGSVHYAAAKGAVVTMTLGVAREFAAQGIRCLSVSPASVETPFLDASGTSQSMRERILAGIPMKRMAKAEEIGELVVFLCSDACEFMTADTVYVSGGGGFR